MITVPRMNIFKSNSMLAVDPWQVTVIMMMIMMIMMIMMMIEMIPLIAEKLILIVASNSYNFMIG